MGLWSQPTNPFSGQGLVPSGFSYKIGPGLLWRIFFPKESLGESSAGEYSVNKNLTAVSTTTTTTTSSTSTTPTMNSKEFILTSCPNSHILNLFLEFLYSDGILQDSKFSASDAISLIIIAVEHCLPLLVSICELRILQAVGKHNVLNVLNFACKNNFQQIFAVCRFYSAFFYKEFSKKNLLGNLPSGVSDGIQEIYKNLKKEDKNEKGAEKYLKRIVKELIKEDCFN